MIVQDCILGDNGSAQLRTEGYSHTKVEKSELISNTAPAVAQHCGELTIDGKPADAEDGDDGLRD